MYKEFFVWKTTSRTVERRWITINENLCIFPLMLYDHYCTRRHNIDSSTLLRQLLLLLVHRQEPERNWFDFGSIRFIRSTVEQTGLKNTVDRRA